MQYFIIEDALNFSDKCMLFRYRAAELKHGRVAMLAALGQIFQYYVQLGDPVFNQVGSLLFPSHFRYEGLQLTLCEC